MHEEGSDYSLASSIITLSDKSANKNETAYNKKELSSDDLVHQNNAAVSANIVENNVKTRFFCSCHWQKYIFKQKWYNSPMFSCTIII